MVMLKPLKFVWHAVEDFLNHDRLHHNDHKMENEEERADYGCVQPEQAVIFTGKEMGSMKHETSQQLSHDRNNRKNCLEANIGAHLSEEDGLDHFGRLIAVFPHNVFKFDSLGIFFPLKPVILFVQIVMDHRINNQETFKDGECKRVKRISCTKRSNRGREKGQEENTNVENIHYNKVSVSLLPKHLSFGRGQSAHEHIAAKEVDVVENEDHNEVGKNILVTEFKTKEANHDNNVEAEHA